MASKGLSLASASRSSAIIMVAAALSAAIVVLLSPARAEEGWTPTDLPDLVERVGPSVVQITTGRSLNKE